MPIIFATLVSIANPPPRLLIKSFEAWSDDDEPPVKGTNAAKKAQETWTAGFFMG